MILTYIGDTNVYDIKYFRTISEHVLEIMPADGVVLPAKTTGFYLQEGTTPASNNSQYKTIYRIVGNAIQFSDNGDVWVEPLRNVVVSVAWDDGDDAEHIRPTSIKADVYSNEDKIETITLNAKNDWMKEYKDIPESEIYRITTKDIEGYEKVELGLTIVFSNPSVVVEDEDEAKDQKIEQLSSLVNELVERIQALESK